MIARIREVGTTAAKALLNPKGPRLVDDPPEDDPVIRRTHRDLRDRRPKFEHIICQVDRSSGEIVIPKKDRGMIRALRRQAEHRLIGWIFAGFLAALIVLDVLGISKSAETRRAEAFEPERIRFHRKPPVSAPVPESAPIAPAPPAAPPLQNVRVGTTFHCDRRPAGNLVCFSTPVYESRPIAAAPLPSTTGKININTATVEELDKLPGVGPVTAQSIILARPFRAIDDLKKVSGIGPATFRKIAPHVTAG